MKFTDALSALKEGKKISHHGWKDMYIQKANDKELKCFIKGTSHFPWDMSIIISEDWLIENDPQLVSFDESIKALNKGKKVKLSTWKDRHIEYDKYNKEVVLKHWISHNYIPDFDDFISDQWEILE